MFFMFALPGLCLLDILIVVSPETRYLDMSSAAHLDPKSLIRPLCWHRHCHTPVCPHSSSHQMLVVCCSLGTGIFYFLLCFSRIHGGYFSPCFLKSKYEEFVCDPSTTVHTVLTSWLVEVFQKTWFWNARQSCSNTLANLFFLYIQILIWSMQETWTVQATWWIFWMSLFPMLELMRISIPSTGCGRNRVTPTAIAR